MVKPVSWTSAPNTKEKMARRMKNRAAGKNGKTILIQSCMT